MTRTFKRMMVFDYRRSRSKLKKIDRRIYRRMVSRSVDDEMVPNRSDGIFLDRSIDRQWLEFYHSKDLQQGIYRSYSVCIGRDLAHKKHFNKRQQIKSCLDRS